MAKPAVLLVGGAWHTADYLGPLSKVFQGEGYPTVTLGLPSVGSSPAAKDFSADVNAVRDRAKRLIAEHEELIVVLHSFGGIVGTEALHGLGKASSADAGGEGGGRVIAIVYIASMVPKAGDCFDTHLEAVGDTTWAPAKEAFTQVFTSMVALRGR